MSDENIYGLVLIGGKSTRMGTDKYLLKKEDNYFYEQSVNALTSFCKKVYLSANQQQVMQHYFGCPLIIDEQEEQGPIGGILSALNTLKSPLIVLACDMPFIGKKEVEDLLKLRNKNKLCTVYYDDESLRFETLFSIWEQEALEKLDLFYKEGNRSLQIFFQINNIEKKKIIRKELLKNINSKEDFLL